MFEKEAKSMGVRYILQAFDDITGMMADTPDTRDLLAWTHRIIDSQFKELIPLLEQHDILVATNTEFAAPSIAEYCKKPLIRTAFGPFIPSRRIPPPVMPLPKPHPVLRPVFLWGLLNLGLNLMVKKNLNRHRKALGMPPIRDQAEHAPANSDNFLLYSKYLGNTDPGWKYKWGIGGYCFNDTFPYDKEAYDKLMAFIKKDDRPVLFFTLGSCNAEHRDKFAQWLLEICLKLNYKLVVGCGWWKVGTQLHNQENLYLLDKAIPHYYIFPSCTAILHHGGAGTTHSAGRAGKPQMAIPLLLDQHYWGYRIQQLGIGPGSIKMTGISRDYLEEKVLDLMTNAAYPKNAATLGVQIRSEKGLEAICDHIESYGDTTAVKYMEA
jgi:UDP:flavonoid glycosyltransferase YjiC (YdhE family)